MYQSLLHTLPLSAPPTTCLPQSHRGLWLQFILFNLSFNFSSFLISLFHSALCYKWPYPARHVVLCNHILMGCGWDNASSPGHLPVLSDWVASESWREASEEKKREPVGTMTKKNGRNWSRSLRWPSPTSSGLVQACRLYHFQASSYSCSLANRQPCASTSCTAGIAFPLVHHGIRLFQLLN